MILGVDIDEVVADYVHTFHLFLKEKKGIIRTKEQYTTGNWFDWLPGTIEEKKALIDEWRFSSYFDNMPTIKGAQQILSDLVKKHEILFITARLPDIADKTNAWLNMHFQFKFKVLYANNYFAKSYKSGEHSKVKLCKQNNVNVMIEDVEPFAQECLNANIPVILFNKPWNKDIRAHPLLTKVNTWSEVPAQISKLKSINSTTKYHETKKEKRTI